MLPPADAGPGHRADRRDQSAAIPFVPGSGEFNSVPGKILAEELEKP